MNPIEREVRALIATTLGTREEDISRDASLSDLGADSLDAVALVIAIEDDFQIDVPDEDAFEIRTIKQLVDYITFAAAQQEAPIGATGHRRNHG